MDAIAAQGEAGGRDGLDRAKPVAFDARHLHQPLHGVAGHAQMMLQRDFGGVFHLHHGPAHYGAQPCSRHGGSGAHFGLTAAFGA